MKIYEYIARTDLPTYQRIRKIYGFDPNKKSESKEHKKLKKKGNVKLGDSVTNLMKHDSYKRIGRRIKQVKWG